MSKAKALTCPAAGFNYNPHIRGDVWAEMESANLISIFETSGSIVIYIMIS